MLEPRPSLSKTDVALIATLAVAISSCSSGARPDISILERSPIHDSANDYNPYEHFEAIDKRTTNIHEIPGLAEVPDVPTTTIVAESNISLDDESISQLLGHFHELGNSNKVIRATSRADGTHIELELEPNPRSPQRVTIGVFSALNTAKIWGGNYPYGSANNKKMSEDVFYVRLPTDHDSATGDLERTYLLMDILFRSQVAATDKLSSTRLDPDNVSRLVGGAYAFAESAKIHGLDFDKYLFYISKGVSTTATTPEGLGVPAFALDEETYNKLSVFENPVDMFFPNM